MVSRCALRAGGRRRAAGGPSASSPGAASTSRNISKRFRDLRKRGYAVAVIDWRGQGHSSRLLAQSAQGPCREFLGVPDRRGGFRQAGGAAGLSAAPFCTGPFDGRRRHAARRGCRHRAVRTLRALRADDRPAGSARVAADARPDARAARGRNGRAVHSRRQHRPDQVDRLSRQSPDLGPAPLCPQRGDPGGRSDARDRVADRSVARRGLCGDGRVSFARVCRRGFASRS